MTEATERAIDVANIERRFRHGVILPSKLVF